VGSGDRVTSFIRYQDERKVPVEYLAGAYQEVDLTSYLDDTDAIGALLRFRINVPGTVSFTLRIREVGSTVTLQSSLHSTVYCDTVCAISSDNKFVVSIGIAEIEVYLIGEIHGSYVRLHDEAILIDPTTGSWTTQTPTIIGGDSLADVRAVVHRVIHNPYFAPGSFSLRALGSSDPLQNCAPIQGYTWYVTEVKSGTGEYQYYNGHKDGYPENKDNFVFEVGYILKDSGVVTFADPEDEGLAAQTPGFGTLDLSTYVPEDATVAGGRWVNTLSTTVHESFMRATGSDDADDAADMKKAGGSYYIAGQSVALDENLQGEYTLDVDDINFWVQWYEAPVSASSPSSIAAKTSIGPSMRASPFAGPAVDAGAGLSATIGGKAAIGPSADGKTTIRKSCDGVAGMGVN
jgi:hypothetical protein